MKIFSLNTKKIYEIDLKSSGENLMTCPECSEDRKKKNVKCFSFNAKINAGYCNHCESRFVEHKPFQKIDYIRPIFDNTFLDLRPDWIKNFLSKRGISEKTLKKMKISEKLVWMPQSQKNEVVICYPYFRSDVCLNIKYRGSNKSFKLESGAELAWYNYDALYKHSEIIIVEGEIDALSFIEEGYDNCISVPNGANVGKMEYFDNSINDLDKIKTFIICTDNDEKGILLKDELIRRIGFERCLIANLKQYKDSNEYLLHEGRGSLAGVVNTAKIPKVPGVNFAEDTYTKLDILFEHGLQKGKTLGYKHLDEIITWETKRFAVVTGTPSSGKSEFVDFVSTALNLRYKWKVAFFSPENYPIENHIAKLSEKLIGKKFGKQSMSYELYYGCREYINENFFWADPSESSDLDKILERFRYFIRAKGVKIIVLDPFNTIENEVKYNEQGKLLQKMVKFARANDVLFFLVAHPKKMQKEQDKTYPMPTMYDIAGSSDFWNMADYGISLRRDVDPITHSNLNSGKLSVQKVKFKHLGTQGIWEWNYNFINGRYESLGSNWDNKSWLGGDDEVEHLIPSKIIGSISDFESEPKRTSEINF